MQPSSLSALLHPKHGFHFTVSTLSTLPSWNSNNTDCCSWEGITCDGPTGHVISLDLRELFISGRIDFESLFRLRNLQKLNLAFNYFDGSPIPSGFDQLTRSLRKLILQNCGLSSSIYSSLSQFHFLSELDLSYNNLSSAVPNFIGNLSSLTSLLLRYCGLHGKFPESVFQLPNLQIIDISYNPLVAINLPEFPQNNTLQQLILSYTGFSGKLPDSLSNLKFLTHLGLSNCNLSGSLPSSLLNLTKPQYLYLSSNKLSGPIPSSYGNELLNLKEINLGNNLLNGTIPSSLLSLPSLQWLDLEGNQLSGRLGEFHNASSSQLEYIHLGNSTISPSFIDHLGGEIPQSVCNATSLAVLDLSHNHFTGQIPPCLGEIGGGLNVLNLQENAFNGTLLQIFKEGCNIRTLDLSGNQLEGQVPRSLANCKMLEVLNLGNNQIHDTFPLWLEALSQLRVLVLRSNQFHGTIGHPQAFPLLQIFDLSFNSFEGNLPSNMFKSWKAMMEEDKSQSLVLGKMIYGRGNPIYYQNKVSLVIKGLQMGIVKILTAFTVVDLSRNKFHGNIPESIGDLKSFLVLNMSNNDLTGRIPTSFQNLRDLESLDLSHNKLFGEIPWQLTELTFLAVLNLSKNFLVGKIPQSQQFLTFNSESFKENSGLCGPPLTKKCEDAESAPPSPLATLQSKRKYDWELMWIGFGVGHEVGIGMLFWTLALWRKGRREFYIFIDRMLSSVFPYMVFPKWQ
ncbi:receptor-like protein Cf-9 homolog [Magnolia sinica]|uniref:receptor-like protein Cf-9 homolog n=1 Tax=Magnolia sinica TaxID=86752 RepID=UPI002657C4BF|nr:receptor-like protein Cf-9 homolog [Magnolia sinica]